ncbi:uncharacterized protein LOC109707554 [Ananas comosus]|uniref:Uncharacterized protein LOC109707554 n=1 Tax=Ananas comosus TaxID=4615 RepID=A0A199W8Y0_ANACO|nr:uncharacterized protein LOC109707554 [Ananas comosus]OAY85691.1 hypothetical protein ACMD2_14747 [Ananas comosus]
MKMISASVVALAIASTLLSMSVPLAARLNKEFVVGGDQHWRFGYNYSDWALRNFPFIDDDILVFKYDPPNGTNTPYNVMSFDNPDDYLSCNVGKAKVLANETQGADEGFKHRLPNTNIQYFASGINDGFQCKKGNMKFSVWPAPY